MMNILEKPSSKKVSHYLLYFFVFIFLIILVGRYFNYKNMEGFDSFAPYNNPQAEKAKVQDYVLLDSRLKEYEKKNNCDGGYIDLGLPPPNPIFNYPTLSFHPMTSPEEEKKKEVFNDPFEKYYRVGIMGNV